VLEVRILAIKLAIPYGVQCLRRGRGYLLDDYPYSKIKLFRWTKAHGRQIRAGIEIPLQSFFRQHGRRAAGKRRPLHSAPPWIHGRQSPITRIWSPAPLSIFRCTHPARCLKSATGHAGQGDGEVDITASKLRSSEPFNLLVRKPAAAGKDLHLKWPRAETPHPLITMGLNDDLNACATLAVREMIDFLMTEKHLSRDDAYMLSSVRRRSPHHRTGRRQQRRPHDAPQIDFYRRIGHRGQEPPMKRGGARLALLFAGCCCSTS